MGRGHVQDPYAASVRDVRAVSHLDTEGGQAGDATMSTYNRFSIQVEYPDGYRFKRASRQGANLSAEEVAYQLEQMAKQIRDALAQLQEPQP